MSKQIKLSENQIPELLSRIEKELKDNKVQDGKISLTFNINDDIDKRASLIFSVNAYSKMLALVNSFDVEVAWHGYVERQDVNKFLVTDIMVYPQTVTNATVNTDQKEYETWLMENDVNRIRLQGHSHVNMSTTASSVDKTHQRHIVNQLGDDDYYIFVIWNKKNSPNIFIYDRVENLLYRTGDVDISIENEPLKIEEFINESKELVKTKSYFNNNKTNKTYHYPSDWYAESEKG